MTFPRNPDQRFPKGDHNRRLALGVDADEFAAIAKISTDELHAYELSPPDGPFDEEVGQKVGRALEKLEATRNPLVDNGPNPEEP